MHRLFWKIFLSFWLALIVFAAAAMLAASDYIERIRADHDEGRPAERLLHYRIQAQTVADAGGLDALERWARELDRREAIPFLLIDAQGRELLGRPVSPFVTARLERERRHEAHETAEREREHGRERRRRPRASVVRVAGAGDYRLLPDTQSITLGRILHRPRVIATPLLIAAVVSALVCLLLSRYLTRPLERLGAAARQFAAGDMTLRVAPTLGRRRDEIADLAQAFDQMAERLEKVFGAQRQLLRDASHELRSPLARLQAALGLARQRGAAGKELDRMEREIERLNELIGRLLSLSRLEAGVDAASTEPVDLTELLHALVDDARFEAEAAGCGVTLDAPDPATVNANPLWLHSALENVVRNAIRYTGAGSAVEISLADDAGRPGWVVIRVRDHGPGVPEADLERVFEPFVRVGEARDRASGGHGLGLAIADRAVRLFGGEISARNEPDGGLSVLIRLRRAG
ncbi:MAG TPA: ATP-binding protein [Acidiferrobacterales bacterium]